MTARKSTKYLVVHVTATPPSSDIGVKEVRAMHKARGFSDVGYHFIIRRNGKVEKGRAEDQIGAHVQGFNSISLGVSMVGGVDAKGKPQNNATPEQWAALEKLLRELSGKYPKAVILGHRDLSPDLDGDGIIEPQEHIKACPCADIVPWAKAKGLRAAPVKGVWDPKREKVAHVVAPGPDDRNVYLQKLLVRAGYAFGPTDGIIGDRTVKAIKQFQLWAGFKQTGKFDEPTVARLRAMFEKKAA